MGKAVPKGIKSRAKLLLQRFPNSFTGDFEKNKDFIDSLKLPLTRVNRNLIAGFITRKAKAIKAEKEKEEKGKTTIE